MRQPETALPDRCTVAIVGGGTAGLALAAELRRQGVGPVVVLEREGEAGGVPRHCGHYPFGIREYGRLMKGPEYARRNVQAAIGPGIRVLTSTTVTKLRPNGILEVTTPEGTATLTAERVVLCTGVREASRAQRFIGGDRARGIVSTGALQSYVYLNGQRPFARPVIFGSELVSFSAIATCRHLGIRPLAMVEEQPRIIARGVVRPYLTAMGVPLYTGVTEPRIIGRDHVEAVEFDTASGQPMRIETDGVIVSGHFRPEGALLRNSHLETDAGSGGPVIDQFGQCSDPAYYSAGNLLRPAETSGWCWREGVATARRIAQDLAGVAPSTGSIRLLVDDPAIRFALPQRFTLGARPGGMERLQIGLNEPAKGTLIGSAGSQTVLSAPIHARPVRRITVPLRDLAAAPPAQDVCLSIRPAR